MKGITKCKIGIDVLMTVGLLAAMSYLLIGEALHEWIGSGLFVLFILHNVLNWRWYGNLVKGRYTPVRIFQVVINFATVVAMLGLMISSVILSRYVFVFLDIRGSASFARILHMLASYWGFVLMSLHLGLHWGMLRGMFYKQRQDKKMNKGGRWVLCGVAWSIAAYGLYAFLQHHILDYMFLKSHYVFFDFDKPIVYFFIDYIAIMGFWMWVAYYIKVVLSKRSVKRKG